MGNIKNILAAIVLLAITLSTVLAFNHNKTAENITTIEQDDVFIYTGDPDDDNWADRGNWEPATATPNCPGMSHICAVQLNPNQTIEQFLATNGSLDYDQAVALGQIIEKSL